MSGSWKVTLPCTKAEAEAAADEIGALALLDEPPVVMTSEPDEDRPDEWRLDVYAEHEPDAAMLAGIAALAPSAAGLQPSVERLGDEDWIPLSQAGLEPIRAGRFFVHTPAHGDAVPDGVTAFAIDAGLAFGTGHHQTTTGCLMMLDRMRARGEHYGDIADIGTGTGLLAFAARALWPTARVVASDIDPVSIVVTAENAAANAIPTGRSRSAIELVTAPGVAHPRLRGRAPYDLLIANILAGPLIELAPAFAATLAPGASLILAGLLDTQADRVAAAYRAQGLRLAERITLGDWPTLRLVRRPLARRTRRTLPAGMGDWRSDGR